MLVHTVVTWNLRQKFQLFFKCKKLIKRLFFLEKELVNEIDEYSEIFYFIDEIFKFN